MGREQRLREVGQANAIATVTVKLLQSGEITCIGPDPAVVTLQLLTKALSLVGDRLVVEALSLPAHLPPAPAPRPGLAIPEDR